MYATSVNIIRSSSVAERRHYFDVTRSRAITDYTVAARLARIALRLAHDEGVEDTGNFEGWVQHNITDRLSEITAMSFSRLKTYAELTKASKPVKKAGNHNAAVSSGPPTRPACSRPNVPASTIHAVEPNTPALAQQQGIQGTVQVIVSLDEDSHIIGTRIQSSPSAILNVAALDSARASTFQTEVHNCKPVRADYVYSVEFTSQ